MAASASNIADYIEPGEIASADDRGNLPLRFGQHRRVEDAVCFRILPEITPDSFWESLLHRATTGFDGILELPIRVPIDRQPEHAHKRAHRLRVIATKHTRSRRMPKGVALLFKTPLTGLNTHNPPHTCSFTPAS